MKFTASGGFGSDTAQAQNAIGGGGVPSPSRGSSKVDPTLCFGALAALLAGGSLRAFDRPEITSKIFQFPQDKIPRIDGEISDWALVPDTYAIKTDQFADDGKPNRVRDPQNLDVKIRVGRVKGLNRLYVLYEAADNYCDFGRPDLPNDALELMVDGDASELCAFQLMPLEPALLPALEARWSFKVVDIDRRLGAFKDESIGTAKIASWKWDFGDGETSTEQHPIHTYKKAGNTVVILDVTDTAGQTPRRSIVWDVQLR